MAWIRMVEPAEAEGLLKSEYQQGLRRAGKVFNILKLQSLNAGTLEACIGLYLATMHAPSELTRAERELLATVVSQVNSCFY